jgi:glutathione S-transferase
VLVESVAIVLYLLEKYDKDHKLMLPANADAHKRGKMWQFLQYAPAELYTLSAHLDEAKKVPEDKRDNELIEKLNKRFKTELGPFLEKELGEKQYLLGDEFTVADLVVSYDLLGLKVHDS